MQNLANNFPFHQGPAFKFPKNIRSFSKSGLLLPTVSQGPAKYNISFDLNSLQKMKFDKYSSRVEYKSNQDIPGIGSYTPQKPVSTHKYQISKTGRNSDNSQLLSNPGPGDYQHELHEVKIIGGLIGNGQRSQLSLKQNIPGVGAYDINKKRKIKNQSFSHSINKKHFERTPGPGHYPLKEIIGQKGLKISQSKRDWGYQKTCGNFITPGPGAYNSSLKASTQSLHWSDLKTLRKDVAITTISTDDNHKTSTNFNDTSKMSQNGTKFTKSTRKFEFLDPFNLNYPYPQFRSPGPARYPLKLNFFNLNKISSRKGTWGYSIKASDVFKPKEGPGVGSYTIINNIGKKIIKRKSKAEVSFVYNFQNTTESDF